MSTIRLAESPDDLAAARLLMREYGASLGIDLTFQGFEAELAALPGKYAPPAGRLFVGWQGADALGCIALRPLADGSGEVKRLYVRPAARGEQLGRRLVERLVDEARLAGYRRLCLDTIPSMRSAIAIYVAFGFAPIEPYTFNPVPGAIFLGLDFEAAPRGADIG